MRALKPSRQRAVLFPQPLLIDEQRKTLLESELACAGTFQLRPERLSHSVQFHRVQFFYGGLVQHVESFVWDGLLQQSGRRIVIVSAANVFMPWAGSLRFHRQTGLAIERALQNRLEALIRTGAQFKSAPAGRL